jgi:hypothetical protein
MGVPQITVSYLRSRAARYRQLMANTDDPRHVKRYRERSQLLDEEAERLARQLDGEALAPRPWSAHAKPGGLLPEHKKQCRAERD